MRWYHWYILIVVAGTVVTHLSVPSELFYFIPVNLLLYFLPVWAIRWYITKGYKRYLSVPPPTDTEPPSPE